MGCMLNDEPDCERENCHNTTIAKKNAHFFCCCKGDLCNEKFSELVVQEYAQMKAYPILLSSHLKN